MINIILKNLLILSSAAIASIGTYPYAKNFAYHMFLSSQGVLLATVVFVSTALAANIALGAFSIIDTLKICRETPFIQFLVIGIIASIASLATGFICVVGYYETLPLGLNIFISSMVTCVNAAIGFSAIHNASNHFFSKSSFNHSLSKLKKLVILLTISGALIASFVFYLATVNGFLSIINYYHLFEGYQNFITYTFSILVWLPGATLFVNASRITVSEIYDKFSRKDLSFSLMGLFILIIALFSGSSFAQMTLEFFDTSKKIPEFFRIVSSYNRIVLYVIMPITFIISGLVNAYALNNIFNRGPVEEVE